MWRRKRRKRRRGKEGRRRGRREKRGRARGFIEEEAWSGTEMKRRRYSEMGSKDKDWEEKEKLHNVYSKNLFFIEREITTTRYKMYSY